MKSVGLLILRLTVGALVAGHGAQKLFGWFGGPGLKGTHGMMESLGMRPGHVWGTMAGLAEFTGGLFTALGFLNPLGPMNIASAMIVAIRRVHWNKPIWNMNGGAELPLTNLAVATALVCTGPGRFSLDHMLGIRVPRWLASLMFIGTAAATYAAILRPEIAETVVEKVTAAVPGTFRPTSQPDLEVETRPRAPSEEAVGADA